MSKRLLAAAITSLGSLNLGYAAIAAAQTADSPVDETSAPAAKTTTADTTTPASTATAPASSATADDQIATVLVTARRRAERLEQVPTSITATGSQQPAQQDIVAQPDQLGRWARRERGGP